MGLGPLACVVLGLGGLGLVAEDGNGLHDVFVADLGPASARGQLVALGEPLESFQFPQGAQNSLTARVRAAIAAVDRRDTAASCGNLRALANHARPGEQMISHTAHIRVVLGCA